jgi:hypothetical protein
VISVFSVITSACPGVLKLTMLFDFSLFQEGLQLYKPKINIPNTEFHLHSDIKTRTYLKCMPYQRSSFVSIREINTVHSNLLDTAILTIQGSSKIHVVCSHWRFMKSSV